MYENDHEDILTAARSGDTDEVAAVLSMDNWLTAAKDGEGRTALHLAAAGGHARTVELLLHNNADPNAADRGGQTPLALAEHAGHLVVAAALRRRLQPDQRLRPAAAVVLPREEERERRPARAGRVRIGGCEREIPDGDHARGRAGGPGAQVRRGQVAARVAEGVELLDVAEIEAGLLGHQAPQRQLEGAVACGVERAGGEGRAAV